ncbi:MAG TPA: hypothetical protein VJU87_00385 [Gemmatimonadaceae bacterium]|nr:hypothetical protein [Gemmatimonadaceae bacterium]
MRRFVTTLLCTIVVTVVISGCSLIHRQSNFLGFAVRGASHRAPTAADLADQYGCTSSQVTANAERQHLVIARSGTPMCAALGRYGDPISVGKTDVADMHLVSMLHRIGERYYNVTYVYYDDTRVNRRLGRPVGRWLVERVTVTR